MHRKTRAPVVRGAGRPFAWVDDEIRGADLAWAALNDLARALPRRVDPRMALPHGDFTAIRRW